MERGPLVRELTENGDHRTGQIRPACTARIPGMLDRKPEPKKRTKSDGTSERMLSSSKAKSIRSFLNVNPEQQFEVVRGARFPGSRAHPEIAAPPRATQHQPDQRSAWDAAINHRDQYPDSGGIGFDRYGDRARPQGPAKNLRGEVRRDRDPARWRRDQPPEGHHRSRNAARTLYELQRVGTVRPLFDRGNHGRARRARSVSRSLPGPGRADMVRPRLRRIQVPQQCESPGCPGHGA